MAPPTLPGVHAHPAASAPRQQREGSPRPASPAGSERSLNRHRKRSSMPPYVSSPTIRAPASPRATVPPSAGSPSHEGTARRSPRMSDPVANVKQQDDSPNTRTHRLHHSRRGPVSRQLLKETDWSEPGIDPRKYDLPQLSADVVIQAADWSAERAEFALLNNDTFQEYLDQPRPEWSKVRWIHTNGLSWDVLKPFAIVFDLHPLALEDLLAHGTSSSASKCDWYPQHLFVSVVNHVVMDSHVRENDEDAYTRKRLKRREKLKNGSQLAHEKLGLNFVEPMASDAELGQQPPTGRSRSHTHPGVVSRPSSDEDESPYQTDVRQMFKMSSRQSQETRHSREASEPALPAATSAHGTGSASLRKRTLVSNTLESESEEDIWSEPDDAASSQSSLDTQLAQRRAAKRTATQMTQDVRIQIHVEQICVFLFHDGTVLSFTQDPGFHRRLSSLFDRLHTEDGMLRTSQDPSMVLQAILDVVGDDALEIVASFRNELTVLESKVLSNPGMDTIRHLHVLSAQLLLLKSTLSPLQSLIRNLRYNDELKSAQVAQRAYDSGARTPAASIRDESFYDDPRRALSHPSRPSFTFLSPLSKTYLNDVDDHVDSVLSSLDLFSSLAENLIAYNFNVLSYSSNSYMMALSVLSVIFLPITFLASYFGQNFPGDWVEGKTIHYFWQIAAPVAVASILLFGWAYIASMVRRLYSELRKLALVRRYKLEFKRKRRRQL